MNDYKQVYVYENKRRKKKYLTTHKKGIKASFSDLEKKTAWDPMVINIPFLLRFIDGDFSFNETLADVIIDEFGNQITIMDKDLLIPLIDDQSNIDESKIIIEKVSVLSEISPANTTIKFDEQLNNIEEKAITIPIVNSPIRYTEVKYHEVFIDNGSLNINKKGFAASINDLRNPEYGFTFNDLPYSNIEVIEGRYKNKLPDDYITDGERCTTALVLEPIDISLDKACTIHKMEQIVLTNREEVAKCYLISDIFTLSEASELYDIPVSTIKSALQCKRFSEWEYKKSGKTWLITRDAIERIFKKSK